MISGYGGDNINRLEYTGDNSYNDRFHNAFAGAMAGYNFRMQNHDFLQEQTAHSTIFYSCLLILSEIIFSREKAVVRIVLFFG